MLLPAALFFATLLWNLPPAVGWALAVVALCTLIPLLVRGQRWRACAGWTALGVAGQSCALQLVEAGRSIRLQMLPGYGDRLTALDKIFLGAVLLQACVVFFAAWRRWSPLRGSLPEKIYSLSALFAVALLCYGAATIAVEAAQEFVQGLGRPFLRQVVIHITRVALSLLVMLTGTLNLALAAAAVPADFLEALATRWKQSGRRWLPWLAALWVVLVSSLFAIFVFEHMPHLADEVCYLFQAKYFSLGKLWLPPPADPEALFAPFYLNEGGKWYGTPPGGWGVVLAGGVLLGLPWLVNPLLGGVAILLAHALLKKLYNREVADAAALLLAVSPWLLYLSATLMMHPLTLVLTLAALLSIAHARESGHAGWSLLAGLSAGALLHIRPLEAVIIAAVGGLWWLAVGWRNLRLIGPALASVSGLAMTALFLAYNKLMTGNPLEVPLIRVFDLIHYKGANRLGFGPDVGNFGWRGLDALPGHGPIDVFMNNNLNLYMAGFDLYGWACGSLLFVFLLLALKGMRGAGILWGLVFGTAAGMSCYWFSGGPDFGARYWYQMVPALAGLTVLGEQECAARTRDAAGARRVWAFVALASLSAMITLVPWRSLDKYYHYRGVNADFRRLAGEHHFGRGLVLVQWRLPSDYVSAVPLNPRSFERDTPETIYARLLTLESVQRLRTYYSDRPVWVVAGASLTGTGHARVLAGPIPPGQPVPDEYFRKP